MFEGRVPGFEDFRHADVLVATDCMSPDLDAPQSDLSVSGCFRDTVDKNTGVLAVRATPNGIATMAEWKVRLQVGQKDEQDQTTFNDLLDGNGRGHRWGMDFAARGRFRTFADEWCKPASRVMRGFNKVWKGTDGGPSHTAGSRTIFRVCLPNVTRSALIGVFPISDVAGGHTFFIQQLQSPTAKWPMAVHATCTRQAHSDLISSDAGQVARMPKLTRATPPRVCRRPIARRRSVWRHARLPLW